MRFYSFTFLFSFCQSRKDLILIRVLLIRGLCFSTCPPFPHPFVPFRLTLVGGVSLGSVFLPRGCPEQDGRENTLFNKPIEKMRTNWRMLNNLSLSVRKQVL